MKSTSINVKKKWLLAAGSCCVGSLLLLDKTCRFFPDMQNIVLKFFPIVFFTHQKKTVTLFVEKLAQSRKEMAGGQQAVNLMVLIQRQMAFAQNREQRDIRLHSGQAEAGNQVPSDHWSFVSTSLVPTWHCLFSLRSLHVATDLHRKNWFTRELAHCFSRRYCGVQKAWSPVTSLMSEVPCLKGVKPIAHLACK